MATIKQDPVKPASWRSKRFFSIKASPTARMAGGVARKTKEFIRKQFQRSPVVRGIRRKTSEARDELSEWWSKQRKGDEDWSEWFKEQTRPTVQRWRSAREKILTTRLGRIARIGREITATPVTATGVYRALSLLGQITTVINSHHEKYGLDKLPREASELSARQAKAELEYQLMARIHARATKDIEGKLASAVSQVRDVEELASALTSAGHGVRLPPLNVIHDPKDLVFSMRVKRTGGRLFKRVFGNAINSGKVARKFGRIDLVKHADDDIVTGPASPSSQRLEEKTMHVLGIAKEALDKLKGLSGLAAREAILLHTKGELLRLHLREASEQERPVSSIFPVEKGVDRGVRYAANVVRIARRKFREVDTGLTFTDSFWTKYAGAIVETRHGRFIQIPEKPKPGKRPAFRDVVTNQRVFSPVTPESVMYARLNPNGDGLHKIVRAYKGVDHKALFNRVDRLRRS